MAEPSRETEPERGAGALATPSVTTPSSAAPSLRTRFLEVAREKLGAEFLPRLERAVRLLPETELWKSPNERSNSVGNLVLHLEGNLRQWVVSGLGGAADVRVRTREFDPSARESAEAILRRLRAAVADADRVLASLDDRALRRRVSIQGFEPDGLEVVFHVVEHFSYHYGQIVYAVKAARGVDLGFYSGLPLDLRNEEETGAGNEPASRA